MADPRPSRARYGSGSLRVERGAWYGVWRVGGRQVHRKVGPVRKPSTRDGMTKPQAERRLREMMAETSSAPPAERLNLAEAGERLIAHLEQNGRKPSTIEDYRSMLRVHLVPALGDRALDRISPADIEAFIAAQLGAGLAVKTVLNHLGLLHSIFERGRRRGWVATNPCDRVEKPRKPDAEVLRFLSQEELEAVLRATPDEQDRALFLTAAMTGMRRGELLALTWADIDWTAQRVRVRASIVRGRVGAPKSKRSSRSIPLADRVAAELEHRFQDSDHQADTDLVFCRAGGEPLDPSRLRRRFAAAVKAAGVRPVRLHDLRHTFATRAAGAGVPMRTLQEWLGHRDFATTLRYADYQPGGREAALLEAAFAPEPLDVRDANVTRSDLRS
jgi:integrase